MTVWARDSSVVLVSQFSALAVTSVLTILVARELGPSGFGVLAALLGAAQLLTVFVDAGISTYMLRELSATMVNDAGSVSRSRASELLSSALSTTTAAAAALILGSALVSVAAFRHDLRLAFVLSSLVGYTTILACLRRALGRVSSPAAPASPEHGDPAREEHARVADRYRPLDPRGLDRNRRRLSRRRMRPTGLQCRAHSRHGAPELAGSQPPEGFWCAPGIASVRSELHDAYGDRPPGHDPRRAPVDRGRRHVRRR